MLISFCSHRQWTKQFDCGIFPMRAVCVPSHIMTMVSKPYVPILIFNVQSLWCTGEHSHWLMISKAGTYLVKGKPSCDPVVRTKKKEIRNMITLS